MNTSTQLKALIRNLSKKTGIEAEVLLRNFMMERFLERITLSDYRNNFILKGGVLIAAMVGIDTRSTLDLDATIKGQTLSAEKIKEIIEDIIAISIDDGMSFSLSGIEEIREGADYPGYRASIAAQLDKTRQMLKIDITTGDILTPGEVPYRFNLMFEDRAIKVMAYAPENVLAEKYETIITRGLTNTRMKDFYDIHTITATQLIDGDVFRDALRATAEKRGTSAQLEEYVKVLETIAQNPDMISRWQRYANKYSYASSLTWEEVMNAVKKLSEA